MLDMPHTKISESSCSPGTNKTSKVTYMLRNYLEAVPVLSKTTIVKENVVSEVNECVFLTQLHQYTQK